MSGFGFRGLGYMRFQKMAGLTLAPKPGSGFRGLGFRGLGFGGLGFGGLGFWVYGLRVPGFRV